MRYNELGVNSRIAKALDPVDVNSQKPCAETVNVHVTDAHINATTTELGESRFSGCTRSKLCDSMPIFRSKYSS